MKTFEIGKTYSIGVTARYAHFDAMVTSRTAETVTFQACDFKTPPAPLPKPKYIIDSITPEMWRTFTLQVNAMQSEFYGVEVADGCAGEGDYRMHVSTDAAAVPQTLWRFKK